jgi:hypothetical protein
MKFYLDNQNYINQKLKVNGRNNPTKILGSLPRHPPHAPSAEA